jgi:UPF0271 protein
MSNGQITIDLNCDMGEIPGLFTDGTEAKLMQEISSANIACGAHAGSPESMKALVNLATKYGVAVGAHISYPDRPNFGRRELSMSADEIAEATYSQISLLANVAADFGVRLNHVKPHGALYHAAQNNELVAAAIARAVRRVGKDLILVEQALSPVLSFWSGMGFPNIAEAFADRTYESDGKLRSRDLPQALITDPSLAADQAVRIAREHLVVAHDGTRLRLHAQTICIHSDTPAAVEIARSVRSALRGAGVSVVPCNFDSLV